MARSAPESGLVLDEREEGTTLTRWLYEELRKAILSGRLRRGARLPSTRDLANRYSVSRRIVVNVYEQLEEEGYLTGQVGAGTTVSEQVPEDYLTSSPVRPKQFRRTIDLPKAYKRPSRPFRPIEPALSEFPIDIWSRVSARCMRGMSTGLLAGGEISGLRTLRECIAEYLGSSRGVVCAPDQIVVVSGTQQSLDMLARLLMSPNDPIWMEDPGYIGAVDAFRNSQARIVPVRVDECGLDPADGRRRCPRPKAVYLTPAHQFALGSTLSLERRFDLLNWAKRTGVVLIEDDYDSEFRFAGRPAPAIRGMDDSDSVFLLGTFNKVLFPALRLAYMVVPDEWLDKVLALRHQTDRYPPAMQQAILAAFMGEGHFSRHLRRMRELYAGRLHALRTDVERYLEGAVRLPEIEAGLNTPAYLLNGMTGRQAAERAKKESIEAWPLEQFSLERRDIHGLLLGFAGFTPREIRAGVLGLARALT
jgi:GntR family transcriptional regulator/MocR family aminotransferase